MTSMEVILELSVTKKGFLECAHNLIRNQLKENIENKEFVFGIFHKGSSRKNMFEYCISSFERNSDFDFFAYLEQYDAAFGDNELVSLLNQHMQLKSC